MEEHRWIISIEYDQNITDISLYGTLEKAMQLALANVELHSETGEDTTTDGWLPESLKKNEIVKISVINMSRRET